MIKVEILRRESPLSAPFLQSFAYEPEDRQETVARMLVRLNETPDLRDITGAYAAPIRWECSCLQRKCGACAMVINGKPALACDTRLKSLKKTVRLEPLRKFPVVADLMVDRSIMMQHLEEMHQWYNRDTYSDQPVQDMVHESSRCLQCGLCLEVCPNFEYDSSFFGMAAAVPKTRALQLLQGKELDKASELYRRHVYEGCGKSLSCRNICPAGLDIDQMLLHSNAVAIWKRIVRRKPL